MALNRSPAFCFKLSYRNLLKADHVLDDNWGGPFRPQGHYLNKIGRVPLGDERIKCHCSKPYSVRQEEFFMFSLYRHM